MFSKFSFSVLLKTILVLAAFISFNGCAEKPTPPVFNLYGYQRVAVVPFDNQTRDPGLTKDLQDEFASEIVGLNAVPLIEASQVAAFLKSVNADPASLKTDTELRQRLGKKFQCDLLLMGTATDYTEILKDNPPKRVEDQTTGAGKWGFVTDRKVVVHGNVQLVDVASGSLVWTQKNGGYSYYNTWNPLPIPGEIKVPDQLNEFADLANLVAHRVLHKDDSEPIVLNQNDSKTLLYSKNRYFSELRQKAIFEMVNAIAGDFRGHGNWTPQLKGNSQ